MAFETPYFMKSKTTDVGRSNQSVEDRLQRSITEIEMKQRKSILKIEQQMLKVKQEYRLLRADVDFSTDLDEYGKQIDPEACRSKSTGDLPPKQHHHGDTKKHGPNSAPPQRKHKRRTKKKSKADKKSVDRVVDRIQTLPVISEKDQTSERITSPTSTDYVPEKIEQRYLDFIGHSEKFTKSVKISREELMMSTNFDHTMITVVKRANKALALSDDKTIKSLLMKDKGREDKTNVRNNVIEIPTC